MSIMSIKDSNNQWQSILSIKGDKGDSGDTGLIAPAYAELIYPVSKGQLCTYNNLLYRAKQDILSSEAWTSGHWTQTIVEDFVNSSSIGMEIVSTNMSGNDLILTVSTKNDVFPEEKGYNILRVNSLVLYYTGSSTGGTNTYNVKIKIGDITAKFYIDGVCSFGENQSISIPPGNYLVYMDSAYGAGTTYDAKFYMRTDGYIPGLKNALGYVAPPIYGAKADGTTNDTEALSAAFNQSDAVVEGGNRKYKITEIVITGRKNLVIRDFRFYHGISITLKNCENVVFDNCVWEEFQDGGVSGKNVQCIVLTTLHTGTEEWIEANDWRMDEVCKNVTFSNCQFIGTHFTESTPSLYENNKPHYNTGMCLRLEGVDGLKVTGCYFTQNRGNACIQQNCYAPLGDFEITNNFFYLNAWGGIELYRYTGMSSNPLRVIQGNRFIGHGLGFLPESYLELFDEKERGVGTAVLLGGNNTRIQNAPDFCAVTDNVFVDNNESSVEGWQWNPVKNNIITGNGVLQDSDSVAEMKAKYRITYDLYVRKNPSQNPIYMNQNTDTRWYPAGETRSIENNTIGRGYGTRNPIILRGYFYEPIVVRNNTLTDAALESDRNAKYVHFLNASLHGGIVWENNIGMRPYFNNCQFISGDYKLDDLMDIYGCTFTTQSFESLSKTDRLQTIRSARFSDEIASLRDNEVSTVVDGKPTLGYKVKSAESRVPEPVWDIKNESAYDNGYVFGGETTPTIVDTGLSIGATDTNWTIFVDTTTLGDNSAGNQTYLIRLLTICDSSENISLQFGSRYQDQAWTYIFPNGYWGYETDYRIDGNSAKNFLAVNHSSKLVLRHAAGSGKIEIFAMQNGETVVSLDSINRGKWNFTSGTAGTLRFGGSIYGTSREKSFYNGKIKEAQVFDTVLSDSDVSILMLGSDVTVHTAPTPVYNIESESGYVSGTGLTMDGMSGIDTGVALLENESDFTIVTRFQFDNMTEGGQLPNFTFIPVFSAMSAAMADQAHGGYTDKGIDVGLSLQNGKEMSSTAKGGFIEFRRDWRYTGNIPIDMYNYTNYFNLEYTVIVIRKDGIIRLYDENLLELGRLTGDYATTIVNGNLTIGARMGYGNGYTDFFKGVIKEFKVYDRAIDLIDIESDHPSIYDNDASEKGSVIYHLDNKNNSRKNIRYALVEISYDLGTFNSAEYTQTYPKAFGIRMDGIYDDVIWVPCSSSKRIVLNKLCKWDTVCDPYTSWDIEIINPGTVPGMSLKIDGIKVLLLSNETSVPNTVDATDFSVSWDGDLSISAEDSLTGYVQYVPEDATTGLTLTASSEDTSVATVSVSGQDITITGVAEGETLIHVSIPYGTEYVYSIEVTGE